MKINKADIRKYNGKQLTVEFAPPSFAIEYEWLPKAARPTEFETDIEMGHLTVQIYFRGKDRNQILRQASELLSNCTEACDLTLDGYKGKFKGFMTGNDYQKMKVKNRCILTIEFDGYIYDDLITIDVENVVSKKINLVGTRKAPCIIEVYAKSELSNFVISGFGDTTTIETLAAGKTLIIDGVNGLVTVDGANAFENVDIWEFPTLKKGENLIELSAADATKLTIKYNPMWL